MHSTLFFLFTRRGIVTCAATYRGEPSVIEYILAGAASGALYTYNRGFKRIGTAGESSYIVIRYGALEKTFALFVLAVVYGSVIGGVAGAWTLMVNRSYDLAPIVTPPSELTDRELGPSNATVSVKEVEIHKDEPKTMVARQRTPNDWAALDKLNSKN